MVVAMSTSIAIVPALALLVAVLGLARLVNETRRENRRQQHAHVWTQIGPTGQTGSPCAVSHDFQSVTACAAISSASQSPSMIQWYCVDPPEVPSNVATGSWIVTPWPVRFAWPVRRSPLMYECLVRTRCLEPFARSAQAARAGDEELKSVSKSCPRCALPEPGRDESLMIQSRKWKASWQKWYSASRPLGSEGESDGDPSSCNAFQERSIR